MAANIPVGRIEHHLLSHVSPLLASATEEEEKLDPKFSLDLHPDWIESRQNGEGLGEFYSMATTSSPPPCRRPET